MLTEVKKLLGISDTELDEKLTAIISIVTARLLVLLGATEVPDNLSYIVTEVSVARFNRIGSEGASSHSVEGESLSWSEDDFAPYQNEIASYLTNQASSSKGKVRFL